MMFYMVLVEIWHCL